MRTIKYGSDLQIGDFVAVSYATGHVFGWYCGKGKNTLQYFEYKRIQRNLNYYNTCKSDHKYYHHLKANKEEFNKTWIAKNYVNNWEYRVMKIQDPESIFTEQRDLNEYRKAKQILEHIKFI